MEGRESIQLLDLGREDCTPFIQTYETSEISFSEISQDEYKELYPSLELTKEQSLSRSKKFTVLQRIESKPQSILKTILNRADSWSSINKIISTDYGKDSCLYFKLSRWMAINVALICLACLFFLVVPIIFIYYDNRPEDIYMPNYLSILLSTNENWMIDTPIFYGFYNQSTKSYSASIYSISRAYFWVNVLTRLLYILLLLRKFIFSISNVYTERYSSSVLQTTVNMSYILSMWDFRTTSNRNTIFCKVNIKDFIMRIITPKKISNQVTRNLNIIINVFSLVIIGVTLERISWLITEDEIFIQSSPFGAIYLWTYLRSPMVVSLVVVTGTWIFDFLKCIEDYTQEYIEVLTSFGRILILNCGISVILIYHWSVLIYCAKGDKTYSNVTQCQLLREYVSLSPDSLLYTCWETWLGQRVLTYILVNVVISFGFYISVDILKSIVKYSLTSFIKPKFFYTSFIGNLCYMNSLFWFGFYYSPVISVVWFLAVLLLFFYNINVISVCCYPKGFSSQTVIVKRSAFLLMILISSMIGIGTFVSHSLIFKTSKSCGPFSHLEYNYQSEEFQFSNIFLENNFIKKVLDIGDQLLLSDGLWYSAIIIFLSLAVNFIFRVHALQNIYRLAVRDAKMIQKEKHKASENCQELMEKLQTKDLNYILSRNTNEDDEVVEIFNNFLL